MSDSSLPGSKKRVIFGTKFLLPVDTVVTASVSVLIGGPSETSITVQDGVYHYTVAVHVMISHANLPAVKKFLVGFSVFSSVRHHPRDKAAVTWTSSPTQFGVDRLPALEMKRIEPIMSGMEDLVLADYLAGEISIAALRDYFMARYNVKVNAKPRRPQRTKPL